MTAAPGTVRLHNRTYKTVALRVQEFREKHPISEGWAICTRLEHRDAETVLFCAVILDPQGRPIANGYAEEKRAAKGINATSALENCETSAIGRALAAAGFGGSEYASADELAQALRGTEASSAPTQAQATPRNHHDSWTTDHKRFIAALKDRGLAYDVVADFCEGQAWKRPATWTTAERNRFLEDLDRGVFPGLYTPAPAEQGGGHSEEEAPGEEGRGPDGSRAAWSRTKPAYFAALKVFGVDPVGLDAFYEAHGLPLLDEQTSEQRARWLEKLGRDRMAVAVNEWLASNAAFGGEA